MSDPLREAARFGGAPFGLLEMGSNSMKFYLVGERDHPGGETEIRTLKFPWRVAHQFFREGFVGKDAIDEVIELIRGLESESEGIDVSTILAVATGVFREMPNVAEVSHRVKRETGVRVRVISGRDEAKLMAKDFPDAPSGAACLCLLYTSPSPRDPE